MHGDMGGFYEVRVQGPNREQFRLFCILDNGSPQQLRDCGLTRPAIAVITGQVAGNLRAWIAAFDADTRDVVENNLAFGRMNGRQPLDRLPPRRPSTKVGPSESQRRDCREDQSG